jgi:hypothetical protein
MTAAKLSKDGIASELEKGVSLLVRKYENNRHPLLDEGNRWSQDIAGDNTTCITATDDTTRLNRDHINQGNSKYAEETRYGFCSAMLDYMRYRYDSEEKRSSFDEDHEELYVVKLVTRKPKLPAIVMHMTRKGKKEDVAEAYEYLRRTVRKYGLTIAVLEYNSTGQTIKGFKTVELKV